MNSVKKDKPNTIVSESQFKVPLGSSCPAEILSSIPKSYESLKFSDLTVGESYENKCIVGKIEFLTELKNKQKNFNLRKCLLSDALESDRNVSKEKLSVFLFDGLAVDSTAAEVGGFLAISSFQVEHLTLACRSINGIPVLPIQVLVKFTDGNSSTNLWIAKKVPSRRSTRTLQSQTVQNTSVTKEAQRKKLSQQTSKEKPKADDSDYIESSSSAAETTPRKQQKYPDRSAASSASPTPRKQQKYPDRRAASGASPSPKSRKKPSEVNAASAASPLRSDKIYTYVPLNELTESLSPKQNFSIFGVVVDCFLKLNQGTHTSTLDLVLCDQTKSEFPVIVFSGKDETFPDVHPGDVVRLHRMMVDRIRGKLKGRCCLSKFLLVFSHNDKGNIPKSVAASYTFTNEDKNTVADLFLWAEKKQWKLISDIEVGEFANILCQVVSVYLPRTADSVLLTIWDGTKTDKIKFEYQARPTESTDPDIFKIAKDYAVHLWVNGNYSVAAAELKPGQFIKVLNAQLYCRRGAASEQSNFCIHPQFKENRGVVVVDDNDDCLLDLKSRLKKRSDEVSSDITEDLQLAEVNDFFTNCDISRIARESEFGKQVSPDIPILTQEREFGKEVSQGSVPSTQHGMKRRKLFGQEKTIVNGHTASKPAADNEAQNAVTTEGTSKRIPAESSKSASEQSCIRELSEVRDVHTTQKEPLKKNMSSLDELLKEITGVIAVKEHETKQPQPAQPGPSVERTSALSDTVMPSQEMHLTTGSKKSSETDRTSVKQGIESGIGNANEKRSVVTHESLVQQSNSTTVQSETVNEIISVINAGLQPGQHTQEMGGCNLGKASSSQFETLSQFPSSLFGSFQNTEDEFCSSLPTVSVPDGHSNIKPSTINEVVAHSVPYKFRVLAAVLYFQPETNSITKVIRLYCSKCQYLSFDSAPEVTFEESENGKIFYCPDCGGKRAKLEYVYLLSLLLHDGSPSEAIEVYLWREHAVKFFKGISPEKTLSDSTAADSIFKMLWDICPNSRPMGTLGALVTDSLMPYPVLDCCIMSYTAGGITRYQMFDTILS